MKWVYVRHWETHHWLTETHWLPGWLTDCAAEQRTKPNERTNERTNKLIRTWYDLYLYSGLHCFGGAFVRANLVFLIMGTLFAGNTVQQAATCWNALSGYDAMIWVFLLQRRYEGVMSVLKSDGLWFQCGVAVALVTVIWAHRGDDFWFRRLISLKKRSVGRSKQEILLFCRNPANRFLGSGLTEKEELLSFRSKWEIPSSNTCDRASWLGFGPRRKAGTAV